MFGGFLFGWLGLVFLVGFVLFVCFLLWWWCFFSPSNFLHKRKNKIEWSGEFQPCTSSMKRYFLAIRTSLLPISVKVIPQVKSWSIEVIVQMLIGCEGRSGFVPFNSLVMVWTPSSIMLLLKKEKLLLTIYILTLFLTRLLCCSP